LKTEFDIMKENDMNGWIESISEPIRMSPPDLQIPHLEISMLTPVLVICVASLLLAAACALAMGANEALRFKQ
jgi:hypothetical protein